MTVQGTVFEQPAASSGKVVTFPRGIPGFETYTKFHVFHKQENEVEAYWLESVEEPTVTFTLVDPTVYDLHYEFELSGEEAEVLETDDPQSCGVFLFLLKKEQPGQTESVINAHLAGPLVINFTKQIGLQKVLNSSAGHISIATN